MIAPEDDARRLSAWCPDECDRPSSVEFARSAEAQRRKERELVEASRRESETVRERKDAAEAARRARPALDIGRDSAEISGEHVDLPFSDLIEQEKRERRQAYLDGLDEAGRIIPPEEYARRDKGESQLEMMGHRVAERLERLRRPGYHTGEDCYFVGANSRTEKEVPKFWRSNANPYVQRQKRRKLFKSLALYMQENAEKGSAFRMWVIHDGPRCHAMHLPGRWSGQARKVTDWNESAIAHRLGVKIIFRSAEAGSPVQKAAQKTYDEEKGRMVRQYIRDDQGNRIRCIDDKGRQTWHPHSHLIVELSRWLKDEEWSELIKAAQAHFGTPKLDAGFIQDPKEACKYVLKCDELDDVRDIDFLRFLKWTYKRRLVSFYGEAKTEKARIERDGLRIKSEWCAKTQTSRYVERKSHHVEVVKKDLPKPWSPPSKDKCVLVAKLDPLAYFSPIAEPVFLVRGRVDWQALDKRKDVCSVLERSQEAYEAALDAFPLIYGCTVDEFLNGAPAVTERLERCDLGFTYVEKSPVALGSAHTPPVISGSSGVRKRAEEAPTVHEPPLRGAAGETEGGPEPPNGASEQSEADILTGTSSPLASIDDAKPLANRPQKRPVSASAVHEPPLRGDSQSKHQHTEKQ